MMYIKQKCCKHYNYKTICEMLMYSADSILLQNILYGQPLKSYWNLIRNQKVY